MDKKQDIKITAFDMDGTLLRSDNTLSERTVKAVRAVQKAGVTPILATGRSYESLKPYKERLGIDAPLICYNGAAVIDAATEQPVFSHILDEQDARAIIDIARKHHVHLQAFHDFALVYEKTRDESQFYERHTGLSGSVVNYDEMGELRFLKAMFVGEHEVLEEIADEVKAVCGERVYGVFSLPFFFEMMHPNAGKLNALRESAAYLGVKREEVMVFGDGHNDLDMLTWAGIGVAMENAAEEVLSAVPYRALSNDADGVARFLEEYFDLPEHR